MISSHKRPRSVAPRPTRTSPACCRRAFRFRKARQSRPCRRRTTRPARRGRPRRRASRTCGLCRRQPKPAGTQNRLDKRPRRTLHQDRRTPHHNRTRRTAAERRCRCRNSASHRRSSTCRSRTLVQAPREQPGRCRRMHHTHRRPSLRSSTMRTGSWRSMRRLRVFSRALDCTRPATVSDMSKASARRCKWRDRRRSKSPLLIPP